MNFFLSVLGCREEIPEHLERDRIREAICAIDREDDISLFFHGYIQWLEGLGVSTILALDVALSNISQAYNEGMTPYQVNLWNKLSGAPISR